MLQATLDRTSKHQRLVVTTDPVRLCHVDPHALPIDAMGIYLWNQPHNISGWLHRLIPTSMRRRLELFESKLRIQRPGFTKHHISRRLSRRGIDTDPLDRFYEHVLKSDALVVTGGGFINDSFQNHASNVLQLCHLFHRLGKPVGLFGQGIGPLVDPDLRRLLRSVAGFADTIGLREGLQGPKILTELGVDMRKVVVTGDDAIKLAIQDSENTKSDATHVGLNIRVAPYSGISKDSAAQIIKSVSRLASKLQLDVQPLPISWNPEESDAATLADVDPSLRDGDHWSLEFLIKKVRSCRITITASYHAAVFSLSNGIPVICLSASPYYDSKMDGLRAQFELDDRSLSILSPDEASNLELLTARALEQLDHADNLKPKLIASAVRQSRLSQSTYSSFLDKLKRKCHDRSQD